MNAPIKIVVSVKPPAPIRTPSAPAGRRVFSSDGKPKRPTSNGRRLWFEDYSDVLSPDDRRDVIRVQKALGLIID
jgi:hypothetical protein